LLVSDSEPILADECDQSITGADFFLDRFDKVTPRLKISDVHKNVVLPKMGTDLIIEPTCVSTGILAPITDEIVRHNAPILAEIDALLSPSAIHGAHGRWIR
jgi:hypothetical protein